MVLILQVNNLRQPTAGTLYFLSMNVTVFRSAPTAMLRNSNHESTLGIEVYRFFWKVSSVEMCYVCVETCSNSFATWLFKHKFFFTLAALLCVCGMKNARFFSDFSARVITLGPLFFSIAHVSGHPGPTLVKILTDRSQHRFFPGWRWTRRRSRNQSRCRRQTQCENANAS